MTAIAVRPTLGFLLSLLLCGFPGPEAKAAPVRQPNLCQQMVDHRDGWSDADIARCGPWRKQRSDALNAALERCIAKHQFDENGHACDREQEAYTHFSTASWALESPFGYKARGLFPHQTGASRGAEAVAAEKADAERRAKRKQRIIDSFGNGTALPANAHSGDPNL